MNTTNASKACLNCNATVTGQYCANCGQSISTERIIFSRLFARDFLASIFNLDRGFFHTCADLILRPSTLIKDYLSGKRKTYFHFAGLLLILLAIDAVLLSFATNSEFTMLATQVEGSSKTDQPINLKGLERMYELYRFILAFCSLLIALAPFLLFKKLGYCYAEHIVIAWFYTSTGILLSIAIRLAGVLPLNMQLYSSILLLGSAASFVVGLRFYWGVSKHGNYATFSRGLRVLTSAVFGFTISASVPTYVTWVISNQ